MTPDFPHSSLGNGAERWSDPLRIAKQLRKLAQEGFQRTAEETDTQILSCQYAIAPAIEGGLGWGKVTGRGGWRQVYAFTAHLKAGRMRCVAASTNLDLISAELGRLSALGWEIRKKSWK